MTTIKEIANLIKLFDIEPPDDTAYTPHWEKLLSLPQSNTDEIIRIPIQIKPNKCIILPNELVQMQTIYVYNSSKNTLHQLTKYPHNFPPSTKYTASIDTSNNILYLFIKPSHMITFNIITKKWNKIEVKVASDILSTINSQESDKFTFNQSVITNDMFVIATINGVVIYDINSKLMTQTRTFSERYDFSTIHLKNNHEFWIVGGGADDGLTAMSIKEYMILKKEYKWARNAHDLPVSLESFGCVLTMDERYMLLFGGKRTYDPPDSDLLNDIYIMDIVNDIAYTADMKCPTKQMFYACLMSDDRKTDLIITCYIRDCFKLFDIKYPPNDVLTIVGLYYYAECVHLFDRTNGDQWKIKLDPIINDSQKC